MPQRRRIWILLGFVGLALSLGLCWLWIHRTVASANAKANRNAIANTPKMVRENSNDPTEPDWPQFRGPTFDAISTEAGLADSWPETGPPVLWTRELGQGYSSFAAVGNRVFTQCQSLYQQTVICLDAETGDTLWSHNYGWPYEGGGLYPGPRSTPTLHNGRLYFAAPDGTIGCLDAQTGTPVWSCNPKKRYRGRGTDFGYACSPVIVDDKVIVPVGGLDAGVVALDVRDGSTVWASGESSASYATPLPVKWQGRSLIVTPLENTIAAFAADSGKQVWEIDLSNGYDEHSAAPIYHEPFLCIAAPFRAGAKCYRLVEDQAAVRQDHGLTEIVLGPPKVVWESPNFSNDVASSVLVDGRLYGFDLKDPQSRLDRPSRGQFRCVDFASGRIIWSTAEVGQSSMIVADQKLILFTDSGELVLIKPGTDEYTELARTQVFRDEICWTSPALHRGCVYLRTQTRAVCLYLGQTPYQARRPVGLVKDIPRGRILDAKVLIGGEREFPATIPEWREFRVWYYWSLCGLCVSSVVALASLGITRGCQWSLSKRFSRGHTDSFEMSAQTDNRSTLVTLDRVVFWLTATLVGVFASPLINARQSEYVLLWPMALWTLFQITINVITWTERHPNKRRVRWFSRGCGLLFVAACGIYFSLCRGLGYAIEWSFLTGFLPAFPVAAMAARFLTSRLRLWPVTDLLCSGLSLTAYFWFSVIFIKWKMVVGS